MSESYLLDDGRIVEAHLEPGQAICCSCGTVYDYRASQRGKHICSPTQLGDPAGSFKEAIKGHDEQIRLALGLAKANEMLGAPPPPPAPEPGICADCHLATLHGYERCYYCEQLWNLHKASDLSPAVASAKALTARNERMTSEVPSRRRRVTPREYMQPALMGAGAAMMMFSGSLLSIIGMVVAFTGLLLVIKGGQHR